MKTINEAIEILTIHNDHNPNFTDADREEAHQLGIEALKHFQYYRDNNIISFVKRLPGEQESVGRRD